MTTRYFERKLQYSAKDDDVSKVSWHNILFSHNQDVPFVLDIMYAKVNNNSKCGTGKKYKDVVFPPSLKMMG